MNVTVSPVEETTVVSQTVVSLAEPVLSVEITELQPVVQVTEANVTVAEGQKVVLIDGAVNQSVTVTEQRVTVDVTVDRDDGTAVQVQEGTTVSLAEPVTTVTVIEPSTTTTVVHTPVVGSPYAKTNAVFAAPCTIGPEFAAYYGAQNNAVQASGNPIGGENAVHIDGDLIIIAGWSQGFRIYRIADNGSLTLLHYSATVNGASSLLNLAVDTVRHKCYVGLYSAAWLQQFDYSAFVGGGAGPLVTGTLFTTSNSTLPQIGWGYPYWVGAYICGDWLYFNRYNSVNPVGKVERWNPNTNVYEQLNVLNHASMSLYNGGYTYDPVTDRLYIAGLSGNGVWVVKSPSSASPACYRVNVNVAGFSLATTTSGFYVDGDDIVVIGYTAMRLGKFNITTAINGGADANAVLLWASADVSLYITAFAGFHSLHTKPQSDLPICRFRGDRGFGAVSGWVDLSDGTLVAVPWYVSQGVPTFSHRAVNMEYGAVNAKKIQSAGASPTWYWLHFGYAQDGGSLWVFADSIGPRLQTSWSVTYGPYTIPSGENSTGAIMTVSGMKTPAGTSILLEASNDGATWRTVTSGVRFTFTMNGAQVFLRLTGSGTPFVGAYVKSNSAPTVVLFGQQT